MRGAIILLLILSSARFVSAQDQDRKLMDRLLKPDMSLKSSEQDKKFTTSSTLTLKKARTKSFFVFNRKPEPGFWNTRSVATKEFPATTSPFARKKAALTSRTQLAKLDQSYAVGGYRDVRPARDARKVVNTSSYADQHPFLAKGKSQKALSAQNRQLSIDEVRELLNKNK